MRVDRRQQFGGRGGDVRAGEGVDRGCLGRFEGFVVGRNRFAGIVAADEAVVVELARLEFFDADAHRRNARSRGPHVLTRWQRHDLAVVGRFPVLEVEGRLQPVGIELAVQGRGRRFDVGRRFGVEAFDGKRRREGHVGALRGA